MAQYQRYQASEKGADDAERRKLWQAFKELDKDGNNMIDKEEMLDFLAKNGVDEEHRTQIVEELFNKCDRDGNGYVDLNEFVDEYIYTKD